MAEFPAPESLEDLGPRFRDWLAGRRPEASSLEVGAFEIPQSGFSAKTVFVPVRSVQGGREVEEKVVLRLESPEPAIYPQQAPGLDVEIEIQYRAMEKLHATGKLPLADLVGYEADPAVLGAPFFVMEYRGGNVMVENPPYTQEGFFFEAAPADRRAMIEAGLQALACFHDIDWQEAGFAWLLPTGESGTMARQVRLWEDYARRELGTRHHPELEVAFDWLHAHLPETELPGLSWGDSRPGNIIFRGNEILCLTDFENIAIAPTSIDLGWWLMFDRSQHESVGAARLEGEPTRQEQVAIYAEAAGIPLPDTTFGEIFAGARYAAIVVRVMNRLVQRGQMPEDNEIWLHNPASVALQGLLAEYGIGTERD